MCIVKRPRGYRVLPVSVNRRMAAASAAVCRGRNTIHIVTEADITVPRRRMSDHRTRTGERLSLTAYVVTCFARAIAECPHLNAMRKGRTLVVLDDVTIAVLVERSIDDEKVPEPFGVAGLWTRRPSARSATSCVRPKRSATRVSAVSPAPPG